MNPVIRMRFGVLLALLLVALVSLGATYQPNGQVKNYITVRSQANASASEVARIQKTETFEVKEIANGWGKVVTDAGVEGYVNAKYIEKVPETIVAAEGEVMGGAGRYSLHWMVWVILGLVAAVFLMQQFELDGAISVWLVPIVWFLLGVSELAYIILCYDPFWTGKDLGWLAILISVVVFAVCAFYQTGSMIGFAKTYSEDNAAVGIWSVPVCAIAAIVLAFTAKDYVWIPGVVFALAQLWQAFIIFSTVNEYQGPGLAIVSALGYLFGMLGTLVVATLLVVLVVVVVVGIFLLNVILSMLNTESGKIELTHKWGDYFSDQYGNEWTHIGGGRFYRS